MMNNRPDENKVLWPEINIKRPFLHEGISDLDTKEGRRHEIE
jgi:hypothetical protein